MYTHKKPNDFHELTQMKNKFLAALAIIIVLTALSISIGNASPQAFLTLQSNGAVQQTSTSIPTPTPTPTPTSTPIPSPTPTPTPTGTYSYIISVSGSDYLMANGTTGQVLFQSPVSSQVFSNVVGNCSVGSSIEVGSGVYTVTSSWSMANINNVTVDFEDGAKLIAANSLNDPVLLLNNADNCTVTGVTIDGNAVNQLAYPAVLYPHFPEGIMIVGSNNLITSAYIYDVRMLGVDIRGNDDGTTNSKIYTCGWNGWSVADNYTGCYCEKNEIAYCSDVGADSYGIGTLIKNNYIHDMNGTTGAELPGSSAHYAIALEAWSLSDYPYNNTVTGNTVDNSLYGIVVNTSSFPVPMNGNTISSNVFDNCSNPVILGSSYNIVDANQIANCSTGNNAIYLTLDASFNTISGNTISQNTYGIELTGGCPNNTISLNDISGSGYAGVEVGSNNNYISQNQISQRTIGIIVDSGVLGNVLIGNNIAGATDPIYDQNIPQSAIIANIGYNPVGSIIDPIAGNTAYLVDPMYGAGSNSTWISGVVYTNSGSSKVLNIFGGTVSVVAQNGVTLFTATNCTVTLQPDDTFSVTFSAAPTINVTINVIMQ